MREAVTRWSVVALVVATAAACGSKGAPADPAGTTEPTVAPEPNASLWMPVRVGDCSGVPTAWTSGPRPEASPSVGTVPDGDDSEAWSALLGDPPPGGGGGLGLGNRFGPVGVGFGANRDEPTVAIGMPDATGTLDKAVIRRYIKRQLPKIRYCYEKALIDQPALAGTVTVQFRIAPTGIVESATATGVDPDVAGCVAGAIKTIEFPRPQGGGRVVVSYPFTFRPAPHAGMPEQPASPPLPAPNVATTQPAPSSPPTPSLAQPYEPGAASPLRGQELPLARCFRHGVHPWGVAVVELAYDASGAITGATTTADVEDSVRACVTGIARASEPIGPRPASGRQQCPLTFGVMKYEALPKLEIGPGVASPTLGKLAAIAAAVESRAPGAIGIDGPILVEPADATPWGSVVRALDSATADRANVMLMAQNGTEWRPLETFFAPVVPVPVHTGGRWDRVARRAAAPSAAASDRVNLTVRVSTTRVTLTISRVNEVMEIPRDGNLASKLADTLQEHKRSAFFADRDDIRIESDDDVPYRDVVSAIDAASTVGFLDWRILLAPVTAP